MPLNFHPPLLNSANPWATTKEQLQALYDCPFTGAITTRTCLLGAGFAHDPAIHQHCFFATRSQIIQKGSSSPQEPASSLNTYGYSPHGITEYLTMISEIITTSPPNSIPKPIIVSIAGSQDEIGTLLGMIAEHTASLRKQRSCRVLVELNLSCPNIPAKPPPAYSMPALSAILSTCSPYSGDLELGIKLPPYTYQTQFDELVSTLASCHPCPLTFITSTNTLGSSLVLAEDLSPALNSGSGTGIGGLAGAALHPLALGNVKTLRRLLDECEALKRLDIIGVGGVSDGAGYRRMRAVGASAVGVGTALGANDVDVFASIAAGSQAN